VALIEHDLVDELRMMVFPVLVGGGKRFVPESRLKKPLRRVDTLAFPSGVVVDTYEPAGEPGAASG
jgi:dihydrofolate reductase